MSDPGDTSLPYERTSANEYRWTEAAYDALSHGSMKVSITAQSEVRTARLVGPCPRCHHEVNVSQILEAVTGERSGGAGSRAAGEQQYVVIVAACQCSEAHDGRPEGTNFGCGINFLVETAVD